VRRGLEGWSEAESEPQARATEKSGKPNPKVRVDIQEPDLRCGTSGTSGHVTTKSSIHNRGVLYKSGVYALKALCLTPGGLSCVPTELRIEQSTLTA